MIENMDRTASFKCWKCRKLLFYGDCIVDPHGASSVLDDSSCSRGTTDTDTVWFLDCDKVPAWLLHQIDEVSLIILTY